eukprot:scaffold269_cov404-Prasinococcus_capsulatus_cf.AAC.3
MWPELPARPACQRARRRAAAVTRIMMRSERRLPYLPRRGARPSQPPSLRAVRSSGGPIADADRKRRGAAF